MKRSMKLEGDLCGNCAAKIQDRIAKLDGVDKASVNFMTMRFTLEADDDKFKDLVEESKKIFNIVEPTCTVKA